MERGCEWPRDGLLYAALGADRRLADWVIDMGKPLWTSPKMMRLLLVEGHLGVIKKLFAKGIPLSANLCDAAAKVGHIEGLQWLVENGCPLGPKTERNAATHPRVFEWLTAYKSQL